MDSISVRRLGLFAIVAAIVMMPAFLLQPGYSHSVYYNFIWTSQFGTEIAQGNLYPRWLPDSFSGIGSPAFYFYPPLAYWISGTLDAVGFSTLAAITITAFIVLTLSGYTMYLWLAARGTWPRLGAVLYMIAPYHFMDFYVRGTLAEFTAFIWLPLIALAIERMPDRRAVRLLALSYAGLILTHLPVAMLTGIFLIAPLGLHRIVKDRHCLQPLAFGCALAIGLAAFYLLPALTMQDDISSSLLWSPSHRPSSWTLFAPYSLLKMLSIPTLALGLTVFALPSRSIWTVIAILVGISAVGLIPFMWDTAPLKHAQFPWRLLGILEFVSITALLSRKPGPLAVGIGCGLAFFAYHAWLEQAADYLVRPVDYRMLARDLPDAPEYLPTGFDLRLVRESDRITDVRPWRHVAPGDEIIVRQSGLVTMRRAAFPIWRVTHDGVVVPSSGPVIHFQAEPGRYRIERVTVWQEAMGMIVSLVAATLLLWIVLDGRARAISHLSKFPAYSPFLIISGWVGPAWLGRHRNRGGA